MAELQTKLANLILGLKTQPELDQLVHDAQDSARTHAPVTDRWVPPPGEGGGWGGTTSPSRAGGSWGTSPSHAGGGSSWGNSISSPNANSADATGWGGNASTGWQSSPIQKTNTGWTM